MKTKIVCILSLILFSAGVFIISPFSQSVFASGRLSRAQRGVFNRSPEEEAPGFIYPTEKHGYLRIPLPEDVKEEDITVMSDIYDKKIVVSILGADKDFYGENSFEGDMSGVCDMRYGYSDGVSTVELDTDNICIPVTEYVRGSFFVRAEEPHDVYSKVIAIDAGHSGSDTGSVVYGIEEKSITYSVAERLKELLQSEDTYVIMTSPEDRGLDDKERAAVAKDCRADLLISLHTGADADTRVTNGVQAFSSDSLKIKAMKLTRLLSEACSQKDLGLADFNGTDITEYAETPFIRLKLGYITNKGEAEKMNSPEFQEQAAETIAKFIKEEFE